MTISARGLFRATGKKAKPVAQRLDGEIVKAEKLTREVDDFYATGQPDAIRALFARDGDRIRELGSVWENAVGDGALAREIEAMGVPCVGSDLVDRGWPGTTVRSFFDFDASLAPAIVTNPPYDQINARDGRGRWLRHTLNMPGWEYCALLLSWDWPAARANGLGAILDSSPFSYCYLLRWKLDFTGQGSPPQRNAWFIWDKAYRGAEPAFRWLDRVDGRQGELPL